MKLTQVYTQKAPEPIGPYSQAIIAGDTVYCSGALGIDPKTGQLVSPKVEDQAEQILKNISAILDAAHSSMESIFKVTIYLIDMNDFESVNHVYKRYFKNLYPARTTIGIHALPMSGRVEIEIQAKIFN